MKRNRFAFISLVVLCGVAGCDRHDEPIIVYPPQHPHMLGSPLATLGPIKIPVKKNSTGNMIEITATVGTNNTKLSLTTSDDITITSTNPITVTGTAGTQFTAYATFSAGSTDNGNEFIQCTVVGGDETETTPYVLN